MIIKGGSRAAPDQLARHLQRADTNERVEIIELQSIAPGLRDAFRDWQTVSEGTRGFKGLYHANIDPAADYVMTPDQWKRAVEVLEKELGFDGQPRAVVMHEKHGRQHIHVVWARTDIDTMTLCPDGNNYLAHERASKALELEFGHERVPGKHEKRDRDKQPEFPRSEMNQAEWQQFERSHLDPRERKAQITALHAASDNAQAFKAALEDAGYVLAKGDRRDFVVIDQVGDIHSLARQIQTVKAAELREFMKGIDRAVLPTIEQAQATQEARTLTPEPPQREAQPQLGLSPDEIKAIERAVADRQTREAADIRLRQEADLKRTQETLAEDLRQKLKLRDSMNQDERDNWQREKEQQRVGIGGMIDAAKDTLNRWWNPKLAQERDAERQRQQQEMEARQKQERADYVALLRKTNDLQIENLKERHAQELRDHETRAHEDIDRYVREQEAAHSLLAEQEERDRQREQERARDGPEPPSRAR
jgi:predicted transcriptional regulator